MPSTVTIEKLVYGGDGLGRIDGQVMLAPFVLPGERVNVETTRIKTGLLRGDSIEVLEPSENRIKARCEYFGTCGGCQYQHATYEFQLAQKVEILRETLRRLGSLNYDDDIPVIGGDPWFYRNRVQLHLSNSQSGFNEANSHDICAIDHCYISSPVLVDVIAKVREAVRRPEWPKFLRSLEFFTNGSDLQLNVLETERPVAARFFDWCGTFLPSLAKGSIEYAAAGFHFQISGGSFFQVNRFLIEALVNEVLGEAEGKYAVDLYAGVGLFSLPLRERFERIDAIERGGSATRDLEVNIARCESGIKSIRSSAENYIGSMMANNGPDLMIADPPRSGLGPETTAGILRVLPERLTLVSCDPATLARDLRKLVASYQIRRLALIDLFPQTYHFETVVHLEKA